MCGLSIVVYICLYFNLMGLEKCLHRFCLILSGYSTMYLAVFNVTSDYCPPSKVLRTNDNVLSYSQEPMCRWQDLNLHFTDFKSASSTTWDTSALWTCTVLPRSLMISDCWVNHDRHYFTPLATDRN